MGKGVGVVVGGVVGGVVCFGSKKDFFGLHHRTSSSSKKEEQEWTEKKKKKKKKKGVFCSCQQQHKTMQHPLLKHQKSLFLIFFRALFVIKPNKPINIIF